MGGFGLSSLFGGGDSGGGFLDGISSLFSAIPSSVASAGIFSAASLVSQMFGRDVDSEQLDLARDKFEQDIKEAEANRQLSYAELAARERMAAAAAGGAARAASISAGAQTKIAHDRNQLDIGQTRVGARENAAKRSFEAVKGRPELVMQGGTALANQAQATGQSGARAFEAIMQGIESGLRR